MDGITGIGGRRDAGLVRAPRVICPWTGGSREARGRRVPGCGFHKPDFFASMSMELFPAVILLSVRTCRFCSATRWAYPARHAGARRKPGPESKSGHSVGQGLSAWASGTSEQPGVV